MPAPPKNHETYAQQAMTLQRIQRQIASDPDPKRAELRLKIHGLLGDAVEAINKDTERVLQEKMEAAPAPSQSQTRKVAG